MGDLLVLFYDHGEAVIIYGRRGGPVLQNVITPILLVMWILIFERVWYLNFEQPRLTKSLVNDWIKRTDKKSWGAKAVQDALYWQGHASIHNRVRIIQTCIVLCPLLGLLGTVTGMIEVFHVMAVTGGGDARAMANGVSRATLPTLSGMVGAVSGVFAMELYLKGLMAKSTKKLRNKLLQAT